MKKKVIIAATAIMLATTSVVSAAAIWGKYKGYDIIRITVDGKTVKANGTPALSLDGRTMVPINMLKDAGVNYSWDQETKTVAVEKTSATSQNVYSIADIAAEAKKAGADSVALDSDGTNSLLSFYPNFSSKTLSDDNFTFYLRLSTFTDSTLVDINYTDGARLSVPTFAVRDFFAGKIDAAKLQTYYEYKDPTNTQTSTESTLPNTKNCNSINQRYDRDVQAAEDLHSVRGGSYSGGLEYQLKTLEDGRKYELELAGCTAN